MHSPPVQPISSSRSPTGSVIAMWLEVTVSRRRIPGREPSAEPVAITAARALTRPVPASATTSLPCLATEPTGVRS